MGFFSDTGEVVEIIGGFLRLLAKTPAVADKLLQSKLVFRLVYEDPAAVIVVDCSGEKGEIRPGDEESEATITLTMSSDLAHRFWLGQVNLTMAITRGKIKAKGPVPKLFKLLPVLKPAYAMYPGYLESTGRADLVVGR